MSRSANYTYDPATGKWTKSVSTDNNSGSNAPSTPNKETSSSGNNLTSSTSDTGSSTGQVEKQYNEIQINTLSGTLNFIVTEETIKLRAGDTVKLEGLGKYLSGNYYVEEVTRTIGSNGYSHSATVIKTDFGSTLKTKVEKSSAPVKEKTVSSPQTSANPKRTHTVKRGDCLWSLANYYYKDGALYPKIYEANKDKVKSNYIIYVGQVLIIP